MSTIGIQYLDSPDVGLFSSPIGREGPPPKNIEDVTAQSAAVRQRKIKQRVKSINLATDLRKGYQKTYNILATDEDFIQMRSIYKKQFFETWVAGFKHYLKGEWKVARALFQSTHVDLSNSRK